MTTHSLRLLCCVAPVGNKLDGVSGTSCIGKKRLFFSGSDNNIVLCLFVLVCHFCCSVVASLPPFRSLLHMSYTANSNK